MYIYIYKILNKFKKKDKKYFNYFVSKDTINFLKLYAVTTRN